MNMKTGITYVTHRKLPQ